ncbi:hypothetical protein N7456_004416 [Penicillium angulare]|uniref:DUF6604 domain-containing protein n=1 Tax=Penicillium angulare TaxID=116970 RepID=A0A9W9FWF4_9EURO|nr:hypothetical protein N7456_004416 [Penicillium angulare]
MEGSLISLYLSYKKATKLILDWLLSTAGYEQFRHSQLTTTDIVNAARQIQEKNIAVPEYVLSNFRQALAKRRAVHSAYVKHRGPGQEEDDLKHKAFIDRLDQAYKILLPFGTGPHSPPVSINEQKEETPTHAVNRFASLVDIELIDNINDQSEGLQRSNIDDSRVPLPEKTQQVLQDDDIGDYIELSRFIYELDAICAKVNGYWTDVASGTLSIAVAGFMTNTA